MRLGLWVGLGSMFVSAAAAQQIVDDSAAKVGDEMAKAAMLAVASQLKVPMSAQFRSFTHPDPTYSQYPENIVCGMVNAENGFGSYSGFVPFAYHIRNKTTIILSDSVLSSVGGELAKMGFKSTSCASALGVRL